MRPLNTILFNIYFLIKFKLNKFTECPDGLVGRWAVCYTISARVVGSISTRVCDLQHRAHDRSCLARI